MYAYSFLNISGTITGAGGTVSITNGAAEEGIEVSSVADKNTMLAGADGTVQHSLAASKAAVCTVRFLKEGINNTILQAMYNWQTTNSRDHGRNTIILTDSARGDFLALRNVAFKKAPTYIFAKDAGIMEWTFDVGQLDTILGIGS
jgi:hypothetical protein